MEYTLNLWNEKVDPFVFMKLFNCELNSTKSIWKKYSTTPIKFIDYDYCILPLENLTNKYYKYLDEEVTVYQGYLKKKILFTSKFNAYGDNDNDHSDNNNKSETNQKHNLLSKETQQSLHDDCLYFKKQLLIQIDDMRSLRSLFIKLCCLKRKYNLSLKCDSFNNNQRREIKNNIDNIKFDVVKKKSKTDDFINDFYDFKNNHCVLSDNDKYDIHIMECYYEYLEYYLYILNIYNKELQKQIDIWESKLKHAYKPDDDDDDFEKLKIDYNNNIKIMANNGINNGQLKCHENNIHKFEEDKKKIDNKLNNKISTSLSPNFKFNFVKFVDNKRRKSESDLDDHQLISDKRKKKWKFWKNFYGFKNKDDGKKVEKNSGVIIDEENNNKGENKSAPKLVHSSSPPTRGTKLDEILECEFDDEVEEIHQAMRTFSLPSSYFKEKEYKFD